MMLCSEALKNNLCTFTCVVYMGDCMVRKRDRVGYMRSSVVQSKGWSLHWGVREVAWCT
jgi:hypothetical protein